MNRRFRAAALALTVTATSATALAQAVTDDQRAGARAQALAGGEAFEAGRWQEAVDLFTRAESVVHSPVHLVFIARAHIKLGHLVEAHEALVKASGETPAPGAPPPFLQAQKDAEGLLAEIEPRIPSLRVDVKGAGTAPVTVTMDGRPVPSALVGVARPVNPGEHVLQGSSDGLAGEARVSLAEGEKRSAEIVLQPAAGAVAAAPSAEGAAASGAPAQDQGSGSGPSGLRVASYAALGVGVVGLGVGIVFALGSTSKRGEADDLNDACRQRGCNGEEQKAILDLDDSADGKGTIATIGLVLGGVGLAAGGTLFVLSMPGKSESAAHVTPYIGLNRVGVTGAF